MNEVFFTSPLLAQAQQGNPVIAFLPMILIIVAMWFLIVAPQRKKMKEHAKMVEALAPGDEVITSGGIFGVIQQRREDRFLVRISENTKIEVEKNAIATVVKKSS